LFEMAGVEALVARQALRSAAHKLPMRTRIVAREGVEDAAG